MSIKSVLEVKVLNAENVPMTVHFIRSLDRYYSCINVKAKWLRWS